MKGALRYTVGSDFKYERKSVELFLSIACTTLTFLLEDTEAIGQISSGVQAPHENKFYYFRDFVEEFVKPDKALMVAAGMDESMANYLFSDLNNARRVLREMEENKNHNVNAESLRGKIQELQYSACSKEAFNGRGHKGISPTLRRIIYVVGGGAIVTTNVLSDTVIGGIASAFSQGYGGHLVIKGLDW
jgi:hypothetical protein